MCIEVSKIQVNCEVALVVRPILAVIVLTNTGVLVVLGVEGNSSFIQLLDGHNIPMIRENGAMVLNATLVDRRDMICDLVALVVPTAVPVAFETRDEIRIRSTANSFGGRRDVEWADQNNFRKLTDVDTNSVTCFMFRGALFCCRARTIDDPHHVVTHGDSVESLPKIV